MIYKELSDEIVQERREDISNNIRKDKESIRVASAINDAADSIVTVIFGNEDKINMFFKD